MEGTKFKRKIMYKLGHHLSLKKNYTFFNIFGKMTMLELFFKKQTF